MRFALATCVARTDAGKPDWDDDRPLYEALRALGDDVDCPAWTDRGVDWAAFDGVLVRTTWDYTDDLPAFLAWSEHVGAVSRLFNPAPIVRWNTHKGYLLELAAQGVPIVETELLSAGSSPDLAGTLRRRGWARAFLKPAVGATARETLRFSSDDLRSAEAHVARLLVSEDLLLQPYLERVETLGERSVVVVDGEPAHAVIKLPVPGDFRVQVDHGATDRPHTLDAAERDLVDLVTATLRPLDLLYARIDWIPTADGPRVNEIEAVEPCLFLRHGPATARTLASALHRRCAPR